MAFVLRPPTEGPLPLALRLSDVGRARRGSRLVRGLFLVVAVVLFGMLTTGVVDAVWNLPATVRAMALAITLAGAGLIVFRRILPVFRETPTPHATAMLVESQNPELNDALASAVEFATDSQSHDNARFRAVVIRRAENLMKSVEPGPLVPSGAAWRAFWLMALAVGFTATLTALNPNRASLAAMRFWDPFGAHPWPAQTTISITEPTPFPFLLAKGDPLSIKATIRGRIPDVALLSLRLSDGQAVIEPVPLRSDATDDDSITTTIPLDPSRIPRDFEFRLTANDADTGWLTVQVAPPPRFVPRDERPSPQVRIEPPAYSHLPAVQLPDGTGVIEAVMGTNVRMAAAADRRIVQAMIVPMSETSIVPIAALFAPLGTLASPLLIPAAEPLAESLAAPILVAVSGPDGTLLDVEFFPHWPGLHAFRITDETGLTGTRLFDFRVYPDPSPSVILDRPAVGKDPLVLLPTARIRMETRADDRSFGLKTVWLEYRTKQSDFRPIPLADYAAFGRTLPAVAGGTSSFTPISSASAAIGGTLPLSRFVTPDGKPPGDGEIVTLRTVANDWDTVSVLKEPGRSVEVSIRVVSKNTLDALLQREIAALRPLLRETLERENEARQLVDDVAKSLVSGERLTPENREKLLKAEQLQRDVKAKLADPRDGLRSQVEEMQRTVRANGLPPIGTAAQIESAARTIGRLADENLDPAESNLAAARQAAENPEVKPADAAKAATAGLTTTEKEQRQIANGLTGLLDRLAQWGGAGEVRADAQTLKDKVTAAGDDLKKLPEAKPADTQKERNRMADEFGKLAEDANGLLSKATKIASEKEIQAASLADPAAAAKAKDEAAALRDAVAQSGGQQLSADLRTAGEAAKAGRTGEAETARAAAAERLGKMSEALKKKQPDVNKDELKKNRKQDEADLKSLKEEQDELRKKSKQAEEIADPVERKEELERLAKEQERLQKDAEKLAEKLTRDRAEKTAETVKRAAEQMAAAAAEQRQGRPADAEQNDAFEKLQDAQKEFQKETASTDEQLEREEREKQIERIKSLRDRQAAAVAEARRLLVEAIRAKRWDRPLLVSLSDLADTETAIAAELRPFAEKDFESLPVFARLASSAADAMEKAKLRIGERKDDLLTADPAAAFDAETETLAHARLLQPMTLALKRLDLLLDAVKPDPKKPDAQRQGGEPMPMGEPGGEGGAEGGGPPGSSIPAMAQLKAIRGMQADLNERTAVFQKAHPKADELDDEAKEELKELERDQREISDLFEQLLPMLQPPEAP
jgi:hypothetical protein